MPDDTLSAGVITGLGRGKLLPGVGQGGSC